VPGAGFLDDLSPAERVPPDLVTLAAAVQVDELLQGDLLASAGQVHHHIKIRPRERFILQNILNRASRHPGNVDAIEGIVTVRAFTAILARLPVFEASATLGMTSIFTSARQWSLHKDFYLIRFMWG
jgi:hypothetical protein